MYDVMKQLNYQSCLLHFDNLAVTYLHCRVDCSHHGMLNSVREKSERIKVAISQFVKVVEWYMQTS